MKQLYCSLFGHEYKVSKCITYHVKEYQCTKCNAQLTIDGNGKIVKLTPKQREINSILEKVHQRKIKRRQALIEH